MVCFLIYDKKATRSSADADNRLDAFSGQSRSTNMVPFHMLHIVSYCAIVTLSLRRAAFTIFVFKKFHDLEMGVKGHSRSLRVVSFDRLCAVTLKTGLGLRQGHWKYHHVIEHL